MLTNVRMDGQKTSDATVSRWLTGAAPMDAGVLLYLESQLRHMARNSVQKPNSGQLIAVGGGKGGSGASTLAINLVLVARSMGYKVLHLTTDQGACCNDFFVKQLEPLVDCRQIDFHHIGKHLAQLRTEFDFVVADLYRNVSRDYPPSANKEIYEAVDLFVTPIDIYSWLDLSPVHGFYEALDQVDCHNRMLVYFARNLFLNKFAEFTKHMEKWEHMLHPEILPMNSDYDRFDLPASAFSLAQLPFGGFVSGDQFYRHSDFFVRILERLGIDPEFSKGAESLGFVDLVDMLAPIVNATAR